MKKQTVKCWECNERPRQKDSLFCAICEKKKKKGKGGSGTLIIYNKV